MVENVIGVEQVLAINAARNVTILFDGEVMLNRTDSAFLGFRTYQFLRDHSDWMVAEVRFDQTVLVLVKGA